MDLKDVILFRTGIWNGLEFDESDLQEIADNFAELSSVHRVPLKLGHAVPVKGQLGKDKDATLEQPAVGFVERVRHVGGKLIADFSHVPEIMASAIKKRLYNTLSIELLRGVRYKGRTLKNLLDAVAILGSSQPAVTGLGDLEQYLAHRLTFEDQGERLTFEFKDEPTGLDEAKVQAMIAAAVQPLQTENEDLRKQLDAEKKKAATFEREEQDRKADEVKARRTKAEGILEKAVKDMRIMPAQRETFSKLFRLEDDKVVMEDGLCDRIEAALNGPVIALNMQSEGYSDPQTFERERDVFAEVHRRANAIVSKQGVDYRTAVHQVFANDPALQREYVETDPPENVRAG